MLMSIEDNVFKNYTPDYKKLIEYGFRKNKTSFIYEKNLKNNEFKAVIEISSEGNITGKVFDLENNEEYLPLRVEAQRGAFANEIRYSYIQILKDICNKCFIDPKSVVIPKIWIVPANPKYFDIIQAFEENNEIIWKQSSSIKKGDIAFMYVASPISAILYKCMVTEVNIPYDYEDKNLRINKVMKIKLLKKYDKDFMTFDKLNNYGITAIRGQRSCPDKLYRLLN